MTFRIVILMCRFVFLSISAISNLTARCLLIAHFVVFFLLLVVLPYIKCELIVKAMDCKMSTSESAKKVFTSVSVGMNLSYFTYMHSRSFAAQHSAERTKQFQCINEEGRRVIHSFHAINRTFRTSKIRGDEIRFSSAGEHKLCSRLQQIRQVTGRRSHFGQSMF